MNTTFLLTPASYFKNSPQGRGGNEIDGVGNLLEDL